MPKLRIKSINLTNVSRFRNTTVTFSDGLNVVCGTNGVGKSTILDVVAAFFVANHYVDVRTRADATEPGRVELKLDLDGTTQVKAGQVSGKTIFDPSHPFGFSGLARELLYIKTHRDFEYHKSDAVNRDPARVDSDFQAQAMRGVQPQDIKAWLANRYLFRPHGDNWPPYRHANLDLAISAFSRLDERFSLERVDTSTFEVMVKTPAGIIPYEFLSSGFRAVYAMLLGIIKEIEYRDLKVAAQDFDGVILIDEIELHLHPTWQRSVAPVLKDIFKSSQIIVTTHSPHVIQSCEGNEVISLIDTPDGPSVRELASGPYGYKGWTLEEILEDVMGLEDVVSPEYRAAITEFDKAIDRDDPPAVQIALKKLEQMLHPTSNMRKLLRLQAAPYVGDAA